MVSIHVENCFRGNLKIVDGIPETNKADHFYHGYGMKSMQMIAEKYGGFMTTNAQGQMFYLNLVIPMKEEPSPAG